MCQLKTAAIIGYGKSGKGAHSILAKEGYDKIDIYDDNVEHYRSIEDYVDNYSVTVLSPGIKPDRLKVSKDKLTNEIDLAFDIMPSGSKVVAVTGTNGKSTVTSLIAQLLTQSGIKAVACGNIGFTFSNAVLNSKNETVFVVELSSFQIDLLKTFRADVALITNITPDHLDRYSSIESYIESKVNLLNFIQPRGLLISIANTEIVNAALKSNINVRYFDESLTAWPKLRDKYLDFESFKVDISAFNLFGYHNIINLGFAIYASSYFADFKGIIKLDLARLEGLSHRAEIIYKSKSGVIWINDSKATNIASTLVALKGCSKPTIVMLGGRDKGGDFTELVNEINRVAIAVCLFGEAAEVIALQIESYITCNIYISTRLAEAVEQAYKLCVDNATVLMSPACTSYDEFLNFEDRGKKFESYVLMLYRR